MSAKIEDAIRTYLLTRSAVTAITSVIRPDQLEIGDVSKTSPYAVVISVDGEKPCNFLSGRHDLTYSTVTVTALSKKKSQSRELAKAIKDNGTNPGTGLAGATVTTGDIPFDAVLESMEADFYPYDDGSPDGTHAVISTYTVSYRQAV